MRILWTNHALDQPAGTEIFTHDMTKALKDRGHHVEIFSPFSGKIAERLRKEGITVHQDPRSIDGPFDLIHGQHYMETAIALTAMPGIPALFFCHGDPGLDWREHPPVHPRLLRLITTCENLRDHLATLLEKSTSEIGIVRNSFNPSHFPEPTPPIHPPRRALFFHNTLTRESKEWIAAAAACQQAGIELSEVGHGFGNRTNNPAAVIKDADIVFATGKCALESIACSRHLILLGPDRSGGLVTSRELDALLASNFTRTLREVAVKPAAILSEIKHINPEETRSLTKRIRRQCLPDQTLDALELEYQNLLKSARKAPAVNPQIEAKANATNLSIAWQQMRKLANNSTRQQTEISRLNSKIHDCKVNLTTAKNQLKIVEKILRRGLFRRKTWQRIQNAWQDLSQPKP